MLEGGGGELVCLPRLFILLLSEAFFAARSLAFHLDGGGL